MTQHAEGTFSVTKFDEKKHLVVDESRAVSRATIAATYEGGIAAEVTHELLMCYAADGTAEITGFSRVVGSIGDLSGSWLEQTAGKFDGQTASSSTVVVDGSGTDAFAGMTGSGTNWSDKDGKTGFTLAFDLG